MSIMLKNGEILVLIKNNETYSWYITCPDWWVLDKNKELLATARKMVEIKKFNTIEEYLDYNKTVIYLQDLRSPYKILDKDNIQYFLNDIKNYLVSYKELKNSIGNPTGDIYTVIRPSFYFDFDNKKMYSEIWAKDGYGDFLPDGWNNKRIDLETIIPKEAIYWKK